MDMKVSGNFWWLKSTPAPSQESETNNLVIPKLNLRSSTSVVDLVEYDKGNNSDSDVDVGSIIEEINRVAAQSPLGPYERLGEERDVEDLMKEAERIYIESSKSFEQLSQRSKTSQNLTDLLSNLSKDSTPTPKSISPLPMDPEPESSDSDEYTEDFSEESKVESVSPVAQEHTQVPKSIVSEHLNELRGKITASQSEDNFSRNKNLYDKSVESSILKSNSVTSFKEHLSTKHSSVDGHREKSNSVSFSKEHLGPKNVLVEDHREKSNSIGSFKEHSSPKGTLVEDRGGNVLVENMSKKQAEIVNLNTEYEKRLQNLNELIDVKNNSIKGLEEDNRTLRVDINGIKLELEKTNLLLRQTKGALSARAVTSPELNLELEKALEELKDSKEINTALQLQLDSVNKSHQLLKSSYDDLTNSNRTLDRRLVELDSALEKYRNELFSLQKTKDKLLENEISLSKLLEIEKLQSKSLKLQNEKDARCIQDLNRQIKEMERIIARKHPDSVSALIVAAKENATDTNLTARKLLEDRIKSLEQELLNRETQSSTVFLEIQDKFNQMKAKYENHIEDLELHVNDLKNQLKTKTDTYDVYTQTFSDEKVPQKETFTAFTQTDQISNRPQKLHASPAKRAINDVHKEDVHLLATIRGFQADLTNKEKVVNKLQKEIEELRKTNRRLQKERQGSLKNLSDRKEFRSYPEKLVMQTLSNRSNSEQDFRMEEELQQVKTERDKLKLQLRRLEEDYNVLKNKRIQDLTALQEAHDREISNYVSSLTPLKEQLEVQQVSISTLQTQLGAAKEELAVVRVERDHLNNIQMPQLMGLPCGASDGDTRDVESLLKKIAFLEKRYEEREYRLRSIIHSLAQKNVTNRSCEQCAERQQQLIAYKVELDQLLATVRALH